MRYVYLCLNVPPVKLCGFSSEVPDLPFVLPEQHQVIPLQTHTERMKNWIIQVVTNLCFVIPSRSLRFFNRSKIIH